MAVLGAILFLSFHILYVQAYVDNPNPLWSQPMVFDNETLFSMDFLPLTTDAAYLKGWEFVPIVSDPPKVKVYCPKSDRTLCTIHDRNGRIVGMMLSILKNDQRTIVSPYTYYNSPWFKTRNIDFKFYYTLEVYFVSEEHLADPGRGVPVNSVGETFRIMFNNGSSITVPTDEVELFVKEWEKQNCESLKGTHYLHKSENKDCKDYWPIVMLVKNKQVVGFSFIVPGAYEGKIFQNADGKTIAARFPNAPQCLKNWATVYKISTVYVTFAPVSNMQTCSKDDSAKPLSLGRRVLNWFKS